MFTNCWKATCKDYQDEDPDELYELKVGELGYKSPECEPFRNWDRFLLYSDLVFIRFEDTEDV
jgi:hypothetical protein